MDLARLRAFLVPRFTLCNCVFGQTSWCRLVISPDPSPADDGEILIRESSAAFLSGGICTLNLILPLQGEDPGGDR